jgi:hypothetical protein
LRVVGKVALHQILYFATLLTFLCGAHNTELGSPCRNFDRAKPYGAVVWWTFRHALQPDRRLSFVPHLWQGVFLKGQFAPTHQQCAPTATAVVHLQCVRQELQDQALPAEPQVVRSRTEAEDVARRHPAAAEHFARPGPKIDLRADIPRREQLAHHPRTGSKPSTARDDQNTGAPRSTFLPAAIQTSVCGAVPLETRSYEPAGWTRNGSHSEALASSQPTSQGRQERFSDLPPALLRLGTCLLPIGACYD